MLLSALPAGGDRLHAGPDRHVAEQREQAEDEAVGRQGGHVALDRARSRDGEHGGHRVRVEEQGQGRAERQRRVLQLPVRPEEDRRRRGWATWRTSRPRRRRSRPAAELGGDVDHGDDDDEVDQGVLDERDERRSAQAGVVGVGREDRERDDDRPVAGHAHRLEHGLDADQLQRDVGHRRDDAGDGDEQRQRRRAEAAADEVGRGHVAVHVADRPQPDQHEEDDRVDDDRVRHGEEPDGAGAEDQGRNGDERVGRVEVAAEQEPGDPRPEARGRRGPTRPGAPGSRPGASGRPRSPCR